MKKVILVGGFSETIELCEDLNYQIVGIIDNNLNSELLGYKILGSDKDAPRIIEEYPDIPFVITPDLPHIRKKLVTYYEQLGVKFASLISPKATISKYATIGAGTIICNGVNVSAHVQIGGYVKLNVNSNVMHDCKVENYCTIAPNAVLLGRVELKESVYVGANSTILPNLQISQNSIIGAGAVVTKNVSSDKTVKGVPAH